MEACKPWNMSKLIEQFSVIQVANIKIFPFGTIVGLRLASLSKASRLGVVTPNMEYESLQRALGRNNLLEGRSLLDFLLFI